MGADLHLSGAPVYTETDPQVAVGFFVEAGRLLGVANISGTGSFGRGSAHVKLTW